MDNRTPTQTPLAADSAATPLLTGLGRSTIYRMVAEDAFPQPVRLTRRLIAWRRADLDQWSAGRPKVTH